MNVSDGRLPRRKPSFEKRQVGLIRQRCADLVWLLAAPLELPMLGAIMTVNFKTPDFSLLLEFSVGAVRGVLAKASHRGNDYETFSLCEKSCVKVFAWGHPQIREGQRLEVKGTFQAVKRVGQYNFRNEIEADEGSL